MSEEINLEIHRMLSLFTGICYPMPKNYEKKSKCFKFFWKLYVNFIQILMSMELISQIGQIVVSINNVEVLTTSILSTVYLLQFLLKIKVFNTYGKTFTKVFDEISLTSKFLINNPLDDSTYSTLHHYYYSIVTKISFFKGCFQMLSNFSVSVFFFSGKKRDITPANGWTPYNSSVEPGYTLTCVLEIVCYAMVTLRCVALDLLFWMMLTIPMVQLTYLKYLMEKIFKDDFDSQTKSHEYVSYHHGQKGEPSFSKELINERLKWWISLHQRILKNMMDFQELASTFLGINYGSSLIDLFMSGIVLTSESSKWDTMQKSFITGVVAADVLQLYFISLAGDLLRGISEDVANVGFTRLLFGLEKSIRQKYFFILMRTRRSIQFRFAGVNPLSTRTFSRLLQLTVSYCVTMAQVKNSKLNPSKENSLSLML